MDPQATPPATEIMAVPETVTAPPSSPPPLDLPAEEVQQTVVPEGPFEPETISRLPQFTIPQLNKLEEQIHREFSSLAQQYLTARVPRNDVLLAKIELQIKQFQQNDNSWAKIYNLQVRNIERLLHNTETLAMADRGYLPSEIQRSLSQFEEDLSTLCSSVELPLNLDDVFADRKAALPFADYFAEIVNLHEAQLQALLNQKCYQTELVDSLAEKNKIIIWKHYRNDVVEYRERLITQTYEELEKLNNEFLGISSQHDLAAANDAYYRSVLPLQSDDLPAHKAHGIFSDQLRNRICLTDTKMAYLNQLHEFESQQAKYKIPQLDPATVRLAGCMGLTESETEADLALIRSMAEPGPGPQVSAMDVDNSIQNEPRAGSENLKLGSLSRLDSGEMPMHIGT